MFSKYRNISKPLGRGLINSPRPGLQHTPAPRDGGMTLRIGLRVNQTPLTQNHSFFVSVTWTTLSSLLVGDVVPSPRPSLFRAVYVVYGFRAVFQMSLPPSSSYRLPAGSRRHWLRRSGKTPCRNRTTRHQHPEETQRILKAWGDKSRLYLRLNFTKWTQYKIQKR